MMPEAHSSCRFPNRMTLTQGAFMLLTSVKPKTKSLSARRACRLLRDTRRRMRRPYFFFALPHASARPYVDHIHDRVPLAVKLPDLLMRDFQHQGNGVVLPGVLRVHRRQ